MSSRVVGSGRRVQSVRPVDAMRERDRRRPWLALLVLGAIAWLPGTTAPGADEKAPPPDVSVDLDEVRTFPEAYRRIPFDLKLLYHGPRDIYNPFYTLFEPSAYLNFAAWSADTPIWRREAFCSDYPLFYVDRRNQEANQRIVGMRPYTWFTAKCLVKSTAQSRAWIEVLSVTSVGATCDVADLKHLVRANVLAANGEWDRALFEFEAARLFGAPDRFVARTRIDEGKAALAAGKPDRAHLALQQAWRWFQNDREVVALLDRAASELNDWREEQVASVPAEKPAPLRPAESSSPAPTPAAPVVAPVTTPPTSPITEPAEDEPVPPTEDESAPTIPPSEPPVDDGSSPPSEPMPVEPTPVEPTPVGPTPIEPPPATPPDVPPPPEPAPVDDGSSPPADEEGESPEPVEPDDEGADETDGDEKPSPADGG